MKARKTSEIRQWLLLLSVVLGLTGCGTKEQTETVVKTTVATETSSTAAMEIATEAMEQEEFFCQAKDQSGGLIQGFYREADENWYLFVPSTQPIDEIVLCYEGDIVEVSAGELEPSTFTVTNAFEKNGDRVELTTVDGTTFTVIAMQSTLPSVEIYLDDATLDTIHLDKDEKYKNNTVVITDPEGEHNLTVEDSVEVKGRGNSTWTLTDKKGYQLKFEEKTSILGMGKAKKWILLANSFDDTMMRSQLAYQAAEEMDMSFVTDFEYVDLWIDGDYRGTYMFGEKVELGGSRLDLEQDSGALFEHDEGFYMEEDYWFYSKTLGRHFTMKEINEEDDEIIASAMEDFETSVDKLATYLFTTPSKEVTVEELSLMIDVDSFAKYYLMNEYASNRESFVSSFYWYKDGPEDVIHLGPIWDFDTCMGNDGVAFTEYYGANHVLFQYLLAVPEFQKRTEELYQEYKGNFASMLTNMSVLQAEIQSSAEMNYLRWDFFGMPNPKAEGQYFHDSFEEAIESLEEWLTGREETFSIRETKAVAGQVSEDSKSMKILLADDETKSAMRFAVWNVEKGQDPLVWVSAERADGMWQADVNLEEFDAAGLFAIVAYADDEGDAYANGYGFAEETSEDE